MVDSGSLVGAFAVVGTLDSYVVTSGSGCTEFHVIYTVALMILRTSLCALPCCIDTRYLTVMALGSDFIHVAAVNN